MGRLGEVTLAASDKGEASPAGSFEAGLALLADRVEAQGGSALASVWDRLEQNLTVNGQLRVRQETDFERIARPTRNRQRLRLRLGADYRVDPQLLMGARITTGDRKSSLEPLDRGGAPLSYQDAGDVFDKFEINLDRLFATYSPDWLQGFWVSAGKFQHPVRFNPIFAGPIGDLVWDEAAHPEGIAAGYALSDVLGFSNITLVAGESAVLELGNLDDSSLFFAHLRSERTLGNWWRLGIGATYYNWVNLNPDGDTTLSAQNNAGNAVLFIGPDPDDGVFASEFKILNPLVTLTFQDDERCWPHPFQLAYETFYNFESFDSSRDFGYTLGAAYGPGVFGRQRGDWQFYYAWVDVQQESVFTPVAQDDFLRTTNFRGHMIGAAWWVLTSAELRLSLLSDTPLDPILGSDETEWRARLDLTVGF